MSKKGSPQKDRSSLKRRRRKDSNEDEGSADFPTSKKRHASSDAPDMDLSEILTEYSDTEEELAKAFQEKSPASKLSNAFRYVGLQESNLLKTPKVSSLGRRSIGLTPDERERKRRLNRSLDYPSVMPKSPPQRHRSLSRSPNK